MSSATMSCAARALRAFRGFLRLLHEAQGHCLKGLLQEGLGDSESPIQEAVPRAPPRGGSKGIPGERTPEDTKAPFRVPFPKEYYSGVRFYHDHVHHSCTCLALCIDTKKFHRQHFEAPIHTQSVGLHHTFMQIPTPA